MLSLSIAAVLSLGGCVPDDDGPSTTQTVPMPPFPDGTTPPTFPGYLAVGAAFGWDATRGVVAPVSRDGVPMPSTLTVTLGTLDWDLATESDQACTLTLFLDGLSADETSNPDVLLALTRDKDSGGEHDCDGFDLSGLPDGDLVTALTTGPFAPWRTGLLVEAEPATVELTGIDADLAVGGWILTSGFDAIDSVAVAYAVDPATLDLELVDGEPVPIPRERIAPDGVLSSGWYAITHPYTYYVP